MTDYFIWNGVDCRTKGIHVSELPPITIPLERSKQTNVPGRPGSLTQLEGDDVYDDMILTATCFIADPAQIPAIAAWLKGKGTVTFANRTGGHYNARIANQIPFEKVLRGNPHCSFAVNFRCYPFWYQENVSDVTCSGLRSERSIQRDSLDERPYVRGFSCAETRPERCQLVRERDKNCDQTKLAIPVMNGGEPHDLRLSC